MIGRGTGHIGAPAECFLERGNCFLLCPFLDFTGKLLLASVLQVLESASSIK
jgi:hypothetical protein